MATLSKSNGLPHQRNHMDMAMSPSKFQTPSKRSSSLNGGGKIVGSSSTNNSISYELFAPRGNDQRARLSKLQSLTAGPVALYSGNATPAATKNASKKDSSTNSSELASQKFIHSPFVEAMLPVATSPENGTKIEASEPSASTMANDDIQEALSHATNTSNHISKILNSTHSLHSTLHQTTTLANYLTQRHAALLQHSSELSHNAERLQNESDLLTHHAEEIGLPLKHYDAVDRLGVMVGVLFKNKMIVKGLARVKVDDTVELKAVLNDVDDAVRFFIERSELSAANAAAAKDAMANGHHLGQNPNTNGIDGMNEDNAESGSFEYCRRAMALQDAAMDLFKEAIVTRIMQTTTQITSALDLTRKSVSGDTLEASLIYTRFHGISSRSRNLLNIIQKRMGTVTITSAQLARNGYKRYGTKNDDVLCPYTELWNTCRNTYIQSRQTLLRLSVRNHLDFLKEKHGLIGMTRLASVFLMRLCTAETAMYLDFFGKIEAVDSKEDVDKDGNGVKRTEDEDDKDTNGDASVSGPEKSKKTKKDAASLASQVMSKDGTYYDAAFQAFLDTLCDNLHRTIRRGLVSIMELDTLCQIVSVLREERSLANASPTTMAAARSLGRVIVDAQERLIFCANALLNKEVVRFKATPSDLDYPDKLRKCREIQDEKKENGIVSRSNGGEDALKSQMQIYESWFPPIRSVLKVLSKIFRVVEPKVFEDIALSSVQACARSLKSGSSYIEKKSGQLHSDLFMVKHLLVRSSYISPFMNAFETCYCRAFFVSCLLGTISVLI